MLVGFIWAIIVVAPINDATIKYWKEDCIQSGGDYITVSQVSVPQDHGRVQDHPFIWCWKKVGDNDENMETSSNIPRDYLNGTGVPR